MAHDNLISELLYAVRVLPIPTNLEDAEGASCEFRKVRPDQTSYATCAEIEHARPENVCSNAHNGRQVCTWSTCSQRAEGRIAGDYLSLPIGGDNEYTQRLARSWAQSNDSSAHPGARG